MRDEELSVYQIVECLVENYEYKIVGFPGQKKDVFLTNPNNSDFPMIRLNAEETNSVILETDYLNQILRVFKTINPSNKPLEIINTNPKSNDFNEEGYKQILANNEYIDESLLNTFPLLKDYIRFEVNNDQAVIGIRERLSLFQKKKQREYLRSRPKPKFTLYLIGFFALMFLLEYLVGNRVGNDSYDFLIITGGLYKTFMVAANEWWRLITAGLLHTSIWHLAINMMALLSLGQLAENIFNKRQYFIILFFSMIFGNVVAFIGGTNTITVGISGGLYGLMAAVILGLIDNGATANKRIRNSLWYVVMVNIMISFLPGVSILAHAGGAITGLVFGIIFIKSKKFKPYKIHVIICSIVLLIGTAYLFPSGLTVNETYQKQDYRVVYEIRDKLHLYDYASYLENSLDRYYGNGVQNEKSR